MLGYPIQLPMSTTVRRNDIAYYNVSRCEAPVPLLSLSLSLDILALPPVHDVCIRLLTGSPVLDGVSYTFDRTVRGTASVWAFFRGLIAAQIGNKQTGEAYFNQSYVNMHPPYNVMWELVPSLAGTPLWLCVSFSLGIS
jgi:hypothetical protein